MEIHPKADYIRLQKLQHANNRKYSFQLKMGAFQLVLLALMMIAKVSGFSSDKHVEVGGLFDFRDLADGNHVDDSFFNTDIISMYNSVLNHVSLVLFSWCP